MSKPPLDPRLTEQRNPDTAEIDRLSALEIARIINREDQRVAPAVATQLDCIARAIEMAEDSFRNGGRLVYVGAGTSGRLGVLDASEMPPTYGTDPRITAIVDNVRNVVVFPAPFGPSNPTISPCDT